MLSRKDVANLKHFNRLFKYEQYLEGYKQWKKEKAQTKKAEATKAQSVAKAENGCK
jgi:hypothetical protein